MPDNNEKFNANTVETPVSSVADSRFGTSRRSRDSYRFGLDLNILFVCLLFIIGYWLFKPYYYNWALSGNTVDIVVFCDSSPLQERELKAYVLYDKVSLSPVARFLGLFQNRPSARASVFYAKQIPDLKLQPYAVTLQNVPSGPVCRVVFVTDQQSYMVSIVDRVPKSGSLYVHLADPRIAGKYSVNHVKFHNYCRKIVAFHDRWASSRLESQAAQERRRSQERGSLNTYDCGRRGRRRFEQAEDLIL